MQLYAADKLLHDSVLALYMLTSQDEHFYFRRARGPGKLNVYFVKPYPANVDNMASSYQC
jgi:hypothetical protein